MCATPPFAMERIAAEVPLERLLFGTDGGLFGTAEQPYVHYRFREFEELDVPEDAKAQILGANALRILGISERGV
jgi:hypothetical protein